MFGPRVWLVGLCLVYLSVTGCGGKSKALHPVTGKLLVDGKPAKGAIVSFIPENVKDANSIKPSGIVQDDGTFKLTSLKTNDGAPEGEYVVLVDWTETDPKTHADISLVPNKYADPAQSDLRVKIKAGPNDLQTFEIASQSPGLPKIGRERR